MKIKTLIIIGLTAFLCLFGATAHAQSDKQIINMDNPDYDIDVERFCSPYIDFDNPKETRKEVNYRYVKYTKDMYVSRTEKYPILVYYISMDKINLIMLRSELENLQALLEDTSEWRSPNFFALAYYLQHEEESKVGEMENEFRNSFLERYLEEHLMESLAMEANYAGCGEKLEHMIQHYIYA